MEFREILKSELYALSPAPEHALWAEFVGILRGGGVIEKRGKEIALSFRHRDLALIKKCATLTKKFYPETPYTITEQKKRGINPGSIYVLDLEIGERTLKELGIKDALALSG